MSRRANPAADRAAQNAQTIKSLLKLDGNKVCADCKKNKHPRWASWNLGIFVCIRCSGIHRGMGTHISRVKSVDLDAWNDEQLQSVLKWGNTRANKYWEAKLAAGHMPSEAKIENFIRTKYESKRWIMDGPMPDPATLDAEGDDDVPLNIVQEKAKIERTAGQRVSSAPQPPPVPRGQPRPPPASFDLFGDEATPPIRPSTADIPSTKPTQATAPPAGKPTKPGDSLFGIDFFGAPQGSNSGRPSSALSNPTASSNPRGDLKSSILSLYATAPKPAPAPQPEHVQQPSFSGMSSAPPPLQKDSFGGLSDAFSGLNFPTTSAARSPPPQPSSSAFSAFNPPTTSIPHKATPLAPQVTSPPALRGGSFFDSMPAKSTQTKPAAATRPPSNGLNFSFTQAPVPTSKPAPLTASSDLFATDDFAGFATPSPSQPPVPPPTKVSSPAPLSPPAASFDSAFNLSSPTVSAPKPAPPAPPAPRPAAGPQPSSSMFDPWGSGLDNPAWGAPEQSPAKPPQSAVQLAKPPSHITPNDISGEWGSPITSANKPNQTPTVMADEDFGGWTSASTTQTPVAPPAKQGGTASFGTAPDPFDNPWG